MKEQEKGAKFLRQKGQKQGGGDCDIPGPVAGKTGAREQ